jgi:hypothetical protein
LTDYDSNVTLLTLHLNDILRGTQVAKILGLSGTTLLIVGFCVALASYSSDAWICYVSGLVGVIMIARANHIDKLNHVR